jgi:dGTPase
VWGADVALADLNLCAETLDGIRNHSWSRPAPATPEAAVVSWADRIAYSCHDFEDAVSAGIVSPDMLPTLVAARCGTTRSAQLRTFVTALAEASAAAGHVGLDDETAEALARLRGFNYERIYLRPASRAQAEAVIPVLRALVEHFADRPNLLVGADGGLVAGSVEAVEAAVTYVSGMTDRYANRCAVALLGWDPRRLPSGVDATP